ncbi:hypothetical protein [Flavobacterium sp.]|uniref:hypothetical protein n=1 Tax=Flavobacterium sp. TaxID=239 RepID=UPI0037BFAFD9
MKLLRLEKLILFACLTGIFSVSRASQDAVDQAVWSVAQNAQDLSFRQGTRQGEFASCELIYSYPYRDHRAYKGAPLIVRGSISSNLIQNKPFNYLLKVVPIRLVFDPKTKEFGHLVLAPEAASMKVNGQTMKPYLVQSFKCEDRGLCVGYAGKPTDAGLLLIMTSLDTVPFDAQIFFSASKNGFDESFKLSDLKPEDPKKTNEQLRYEFSQCLLNLVQKQMDSMDVKK